MQTFKQYCKEILDRVRDRLDMETGIVLQIQDSRVEIVTLATNTGVFVEGEAYNYFNTICAQVIDQGKTVTITETISEDLKLPHPLYMPSTLKAYIGTPIRLNDELWGILDFTSFSAKLKPFSDEEVVFIEESAATISGFLQDGEMPANWKRKFPLENLVSSD